MNFVFPSSRKFPVFWIWCGMFLQKYFIIPVIIFIGTGRVHTSSHRERSLGYIQMFCNEPCFAKKKHSESGNKHAFGVCVCGVRRLEATSCLQVG